MLGHPRVSGPFFELGVDHAVLALATGRGGGRLAAGAVRRRRTALRAGLLVHHAGDPVGLLLELLQSRRHTRVVLLLNRAPSLGDDAIQRRRVALRDLVLVLGDRLFQRVAEVVELVAALDLLAPLLVVGLMR